MRAHAITFVPALGALVLACGGQPAEGASARSAAVAPALRLSVVVGDGSRTPRRARLRCDAGSQSAAGFLSARAPALCRGRRRLATLLTRPVDPRRACTEIYGGPQTALVRGTIGRRRISRRFSRVDGCRIAEWEALHPFLPRTSGVQAPDRSGR